MLTKWLVIILCGLLIALALYLLVQWVRKAARGKCCEGCAGCPQADSCDAQRSESEEKE